MKTFSTFILEASAKNAADSMGKLHETLVGRALNGGEHMEHHRADDRTPEEIHNIHAKALYGDNYASHPEYKKAVANAEHAAGEIKSHLKKHGITKITRVAYTSQPGDHHKETKVHDPNSTADLIVTGHNGKQVGVSLKVGKTTTPNYKNPGVKTYEGWSGRKLSHLNKEHTDLLAKHGNPSHEQYKAMRDGSNPEHRQAAAAIKKSSDDMNKKMASEIHKGLSTKSHDELHSIIKKSTSPETHLPTIVSHTVTGSNNSMVSHDVHDQGSHVDDYLNHFEGLHLRPHAGGTSVTIYGTHKKTGKVMPVWRTTVYAGGKPTNSSPRGATTLPSENKKLS